MSDGVKCYWLEPTDQVEVSYRRYRGYPHKDNCSLTRTRIHDAEVAVERGPVSKYPDYHGDWAPHDDPRWPKQCACGYVFQDDDAYQVNPNALFKRSDTGELITKELAPPGAMFHCDWRVGHAGYEVGSDGVLLTVKLPEGTWWCVDGPTYKDGVRGPKGWTRTGVIPEITATPSIDVGTWHGWLQYGYLKSC